MEPLPGIDSVYPSGVAFAPSALPSVDPAPGLFSMTTGLPRRSASLGMTMRARVSTAPPAGHGTITEIARVG